MRRALACCALLSLLIGHVPEAKPPVPYAGPRLPSAAPTGWMLWYEDETYEDCGTDAARLEGGIPSAPQTQCSDAWGKAVGYRFPTKAECDEIAWDLNRKSREEFKCSIERPGETSDDVPSPSAGQP